MLKTLALISLASTAATQADGELSWSYVDVTKAPETPLESRETSALVSLQVDLALDRIRLRHVKAQGENEALLRESKRRLTRVLHLLEERRLDMESDQSRYITAARELKKSEAEHQASYTRAQVEHALATRRLKSARARFNEGTVDLEPAHTVYRKLEQVVEAAHEDQMSSVRTLIEAEANLQAVQELEDEARREEKRVAADLAPLDEEIVALESQLEEMEASSAAHKKAAELALAIELQEEEIRLRSAPRKVSQNEVFVAQSRARHIRNEWLDARAAAAAKGLPLLVNFTSHSCIDCRQMEVETFRDPSVENELLRFVEGRLHLDSQDLALGAEHEDRLKVLSGEMAVPFYVVLDPRTGEELGRHAGPVQEPETFAAFLSQARTSLGAAPSAATDTELWRRIFELEDEIDRLTRTAESEGAGAPAGQ